MSLTITFQVFRARRFDDACEYRLLDQAKFQESDTPYSALTNIVLERLALPDPATYDHIRIYAVRLVSYGTVSQLNYSVRSFDCGNYLRISWT